MVEMDNNSAVVQTILDAGFCFVGGSALHTTVANWIDRNHDLAGLIRTHKMVLRKYGLAYAALGGINTGVTLSMQHYRGKRDWLNGAAGGFAAGATVIACRGRGIPAALQAGSLLAGGSAGWDLGQHLRKEYDAKKKPSTDA